MRYASGHAQGRGQRRRHPLAGPAPHARVATVRILAAERHPAVRAPATSRRRLSRARGEPSDAVRERTGDRTRALGAGLAPRQ